MSGGLVHATSEEWRSGSASDGTQLERQTLSQLLERRAIEQEAADRRIEVDMAEVRRDGARPRPSSSRPGRS